MDTPVGNDGWNSFKFKSFYWTSCSSELFKEVRACALQCIQSPHRFMYWCTVCQMLLQLQLGFFFGGGAVGVHLPLSCMLAVCSYMKLIRPFPILSRLVYIQSFQYPSLVSNQGYKRQSLLLFTHSCGGIRDGFAPFSRVFWITKVIIWLVPRWEIAWECQMR